MLPYETYCGVYLFPCAENGSNAKPKINIQNLGLRYARLCYITGAFETSLWLSIQSQAWEKRDTILGGLQYCRAKCKVDVHTDLTFFRKFRIDYQDYAPRRKQVGRNTANKYMMPPVHLAMRQRSALQQCLQAWADTTVNFRLSALDVRSESSPAPQ